MNKQFLEAAKIQEGKLYLVRVEGSSIIGKLKFILTKNSIYLSIENPRVVVQDGLTFLMGSPDTIPLYQTPSFLYEIKNEEIITFYEKSTSLIHRVSTMSKMN